MQLLFCVGYTGLVALMWQAFVPVQLPDRYTYVIISAWLILQVARNLLV